MKSWRRVYMLMWWYFIVNMPGSHRIKGVVIKIKLKWEETFSNISGVC